MNKIKKYRNKFLNWIFPKRRKRLLSEIMKRDQELGLYDKILFPIKKEVFDKIPPMNISKYEVNKDKKKDKTRESIPPEDG